MANRKSHDPGPHFDSSADEGSDKVLRKMPTDHFNSMIRVIRRGSADRAETLKTIAEQRLAELEIELDPSLAISTTPPGSDHFDALSFKVWAAAVTVDDEDAIEQLQSIQATAQVRID